MVRTTDLGRGWDRGIFRLRRLRIQVRTYAPSKGEPMKSFIGVLTGIFYSGPYIWEVEDSEQVAATKIAELHQGSLLENIFYPGISAKVKGKTFKVTRWGIGRMPMSGNSFVHIFVGQIYSDGSKTVIKAIFRLNLLVFCFSLFWLTAAYLGCGVMVLASSKSVLLNGDRTKLSSILFGIGFPIAGTLMFLFFRRMAKSNEEEIMAAMKSKFGAPLVGPK
jgi:hypothetical protein